MTTSRPCSPKKPHQQESLGPIYDVQTLLPVPPSHTNKLFDASDWRCNGACPPPIRYILLSRWTGHPVFDSSTHSMHVSHCRLLGINLSICSNRAHLVVQTKSHKEKFFKTAGTQKAEFECALQLLHQVFSTHIKKLAILILSEAPKCALIAAPWLLRVNKTHENYIPPDPGRVLLDDISG